MRAGIVLRAAMCLGLLGSTAGAAPVLVKPVSLDGYLSDLDALTARVAASGAADQTAIVSSLPTAWVVSLGTTEYRVESAWIAGALVSTSAEPPEKRRDRLLAQIALARNEALVLGQEVPPPAGQNARRLLQQVLADREFQNRQGVTLAQALFDRLVAWYDDIRRRLSLPEGAAGRFTLVMIMLAGVVAVAAVVRWLSGRSRRRGARSVEPPAASAVRQSAQWLDDAMEAIRRGDSRQAARCGYQASLLSLEEQGLWQTDDARTPREYLRLFHANDYRQQPFSSVIHDFEASWYGGAPIDSGHLLQYLRDCGCGPSHD